jgi:hypothetical protein
MSHPYHHARSSVKRFGGQPDDYIAIHNWFDATKELHGDFRHRAVRHHAHGIFEAERVFGITIKRASDGKEVPVRPIAEQHVIEDCGFIPTLSDWLKNIKSEPWMNNPIKLSKTLGPHPPANNAFHTTSGLEDGV